MDRQLLLTASGLIATRVIDGLTNLETSNSPYPPSSNVYSGRLGAAVFLAARAQIAQDERSREVALRVAGEIASATAELEEDTLGIGGFVGLGGLIYGLTKVGQLTGERALTDDARHLAGRLTAEFIARDRHLDVVHGAAGALLALLALPAPAEAMGDGVSALDRAEICAHHLLQPRRRSTDGPPVWLFDADPAPASGFAHGAAGIAVALARLHKHRPRPEWLRGIFQALAFLRGHYDPTLDNWIPRATEDGVSTLGWCHGAPGVAMAHLSIVADLISADLQGRSTELEGDLHAALTACGTHHPSPLDHLCCGNMSRAEAFLVAHLHFDDAAYLEHSHRFARWVLRSAKTHGRFVVAEDPTSAFGFFQGLAGVGYGFLRIAEPRRLPCVLLME